MKSDLLPFWRSFLRDPRRIGAIAPAGRPLGEAMVREVLAVGHPGIVIELGAGTGSITRALFEFRHLMTELIAIEKTPELAMHLRKKFPDMRIHVHCASEVERLSLPVHSNLTLVSSLPFRSLPTRDKHRLSSAIARISEKSPHFRLIQYSYFGRLPFPSPAKNLVWQRKRTVLHNLPPATVWVLERT
ncbi:class I SAM-dependent methyltransferase [Zoogloea sp.]|uniref:class I SAM-dependent methyltransferase n=1 Tax=Zoogloea sp. TaxID=49181 RepID=UPI0035B27EEF